MRLKRVNTSGPGLTRQRAGKGWRYLDAAGRQVTDPEVIARIEALVLPPAWQDVWICPLGDGHIQATGVDAAGRRQYRYHDHWRVMRDLAKHERILDFAEALPPAREVLHEQLDQPRMTRERVLAAAVRLLDLGFFRVGGEHYAETNNSFGLATIRRDHVSVSRAGT
ncbi:MAG: topoisomerase, partial [Frankiales bacterium]|nr:topoisomerase [Frankiales bacterium]